MDIKTILLVDDDPSIRKVAQITLEDVGNWQVNLASSGEEALELLKQQVPDLILLDVQMPKMDGPATLKELRANPATKDIPVIFLTAKVKGTDPGEYTQLGAAGMISKPFDPLRLPAQILELLQSL